MTTSDTLLRLQRAEGQDELLASLKDLKNSVIGNVWRKVQVVDDEPTIRYLLGLLDPHRLQKESLGAHWDIINETAVIIGAVANIGPRTLGPLVQNNAAERLLDFIRAVLASSPGLSTTSKVLPSLIRALRNLLLATADLVWGHIWGVGAETEVVSTGLVGLDLKGGGRPDGLVSHKGYTDGSYRPVEGGGHEHWRYDAALAANATLGLVFRPDNLTAIMSLLSGRASSQVQLPLYQLLARLVVLSSHRETLVSWSPTTGGGSASPPFIISHLVTQIAGTLPHGTVSTKRPNPKVLEAALDLLAAIVRDQPKLAATIRSWPHGANEPESPVAIEVAVQEDTADRLPGITGELMDLLSNSQIAVRIAAAHCLVNLLKADSGQRSTQRVRSTILLLQLLDIVAGLFDADGLEDRIKLCFVLAALVADNARLQEQAAKLDISKKLLDLIPHILDQGDTGDLPTDLAYRSHEAILLALASLCMQCDESRRLVCDSDSRALEFVNTGLGHPSYGVRAAACQLARALSRSVNILRTSLWDSHVANHVVACFMRQITIRNGRVRGDWATDSANELGDRTWTVEVAATATICNLFTDFSPMRNYILVVHEGKAFDMLCQLTRAPYEPAALNALWAIKNFLFRSSEEEREKVMHYLGWAHLKQLLSPETAMSLRNQGFQILQNLLADLPIADISKTVDHLDESELLDLVQAAVKETDTSLRVSVLYLTSNLAGGNEKLRNALVGRVEIVEALSEALNAPADEVKLPALRALLYLTESNARSRRPRQAMVDLLQPYQLRPRLKDLAENSISCDVRISAETLLDVLDRSK